MNSNMAEMTQRYSFDKDVEYPPYNANHVFTPETEYPYNEFPVGKDANGNKIKYKPTRFINWEPRQEDIILRYENNFLIMNWKDVFPEYIRAEEQQKFKMRKGRSPLQNILCEQINFYCCFYDKDNQLLANMLTCKIATDRNMFPLQSFQDYTKFLNDTLFTPDIIANIRRMVDENDVGDVVKELFSQDFVKDMYVVTFMFKVLHMFVEHFIFSCGCNNPQVYYKEFTRAYIGAIKLIKPEIQDILYTYTKKTVDQQLSANNPMLDMRQIQGLTATTITSEILGKNLMCDGLVKLTFASEWDPIMKRPSRACVGLIRHIVTKSIQQMRKQKLSHSLVKTDDPSRILLEAANQDSAGSVTRIRSNNPGTFTCMEYDMRIILGEIILSIDISPLKFYLVNLPAMNPLSELLIRTIIYNKFHSSLTMKTLSTEQKYILLLYVRHIIMEMYQMNEEDTVSSALINLLTAKITDKTSKVVTSKDINAVNKYVKLNNLKEHILFEKNVDEYVEKITDAVMSSYTVVNHNRPDLLDTELEYDNQQMRLELLEMVVCLFTYIKNDQNI